MPNKILINPPFCYFASFLIVWLKGFINEPDSSRDLIIFMISFISLLKIINVVLLDPNMFLRIVASVVDGAAVNPYRIKKLLASGLSTFFIKGNPFFSNSSKSQPKNPLDCPILCN